MGFMARLRSKGLRVIVMKLYELPRNTWFTIEGERYLFKKLDGAYSICLTEDGQIVRVGASDDVEPEDSDE